MVLCAADAQIWQRAVIQGFRACDAIMRGLLRGSRWGGFIAVRVVPVCEVEVGSAWSRHSWRATFRATKRLAIAESIYKSQRESSLGLPVLAQCDVVAFVRQLGKYAKANKSDSTAYGLMKGSHSSFFAHHLCCISESIVGQEVATIHAHALAMAPRADHDLD